MWFWISSVVIFFDVIGMRLFHLILQIRDFSLIQNKMSKHMRSLGKKIKGKKKVEDKDQDSAWAACNIYQFIRFFFLYLYWSSIAFLAYI